MNVDSLTLAARMAVSESASDFDDVFVVLNVILSGKRLAAALQSMTHVSLLPKSFPREGSPLIHTVALARC